MRIPPIDHHIPPPKPVGVAKALANIALLRSALKDVLSAFDKAIADGKYHVMNKGRVQSEK